jgi:hypothetical protein
LPAHYHVLRRMKSIIDNALFEILLIHCSSATRYFYVSELSTTNSCRILSFPKLYVSKVSDVTVV